MPMMLAVAAAFAVAVVATPVRAQLRLTVLY
jgi:hypothetical protein